MVKAAISLARLCKDVLEVNPFEMEATGALTKAGKPARRRVPWSEEKMLDCLMQELEHSHYDAGEALRTHILTAYWHPTGEHTDAARQRRGADVTTLAVLPRGSKRRAAQGARLRMAATIAELSKDDDEGDEGVSRPSADGRSKRRRTEPTSEEKDEWVPEEASSSSDEDSEEDWAQDDEEGDDSDDEDFDPDE